MSRPSLRHIRANPCFQAMAAVCHDHGLNYDIEIGGKHPQLVVFLNDQVLRAAFPSTPSDRRSHLNSAAQLRRRIEAVAAPKEDVTMDQKTVTVLDQDVRVVTYKGEPVVTFAMVDEIHKSPKDSARRTFNDHRERFVEGEDFVEVGSDVIRTDLPDGVFSKFAPKGILITRRGYLKLVKPMGDDRAWEVQGEMIDRYFAVEKIAKAAVAGEMTLPESVWRRIGGVVKSVTHKHTEDLRAGVELVLEEVSRLGREIEHVKAAPVVPAFDLAGTVTSRDIMDMAAIPRDGRVRGTTGGIITRAMKDYCLAHGFVAQRAPEHIDPDRRWRFPREAAQEWLTGPTMGGEIIRNHIAKTNSRRARKGQQLLTLIPTT